jgi:hypothetical protein
MQNPANPLPAAHAALFVQVSPPDSQVHLEPTTGSQLPSEPTVDPEEAPEESDSDCDELVFQDLCENAPVDTNNDPYEDDGAYQDDQGASDGDQGASDGVATPTAVGRRNYRSRIKAKKPKKPKNKKTGRKSKAGSSRRKKARTGTAKKPRQQLLEWDEETQEYYVATAPRARPSRKWHPDNILQHPLVKSVANCLQFEECYPDFASSTAVISLN